MTAKKKTVDAGAAADYDDDDNDCDDNFIPQTHNSTDNQREYPLSLLNFCIM